MQPVVVRRLHAIIVIVVAGDDVLRIKRQRDDVGAAKWMHALEQAVSAVVDQS